ncbi:MAG: 8-oxo-dGTP diphosphatase [SAR324 cluster bacterium]|nr:8-oxo-dGTP diphosphatase [SAR324 cluster bacterium]
MKIENIDWNTWQPKENATLLFVIQGNNILLIHKKRGLGAGKINGPGGRLEPGESPYECAVREVQEELCITPFNLTQCGELRFQFIDGHSIHGYVFTASDYEGTPQETSEAIPIWSTIEKIPYDQMWEDDQYWVPWMLEGIYFDARFLFDEDTMLGMQMSLERKTSPSS